MMVHYSEDCFLAKCLLLLALLVQLVLLAWAMNAGLLKIALYFTWVVLVMKLQRGCRLREIPVVKLLLLSDMKQAQRFPILWRLWMRLYS